MSRSTYCSSRSSMRWWMARAIHQRMLERDEQYVLLDISHKPAAWIRERFPTLTRRCLEFGFDLTAGPVPVVPAAHYSCGGVAVDGDGRSTLGHPVSYT